MKKTLAFLYLLFFSHTAFAADMSFGGIDFVPGGNPMVATMSVVGGSLACTFTSYYTCPPFGTRGSTLISGTTGGQVQISCEKTAAISNNTLVLSIQAAQVRIGTTTASCNNVGRTVITHTISGIQANNTLYTAARLHVPNNPVGLEGPYSSSNSGGIPLIIRLIFI